MIYKCVLFINRGSYTFVYYCWLCCFPDMIKIQIQQMAARRGITTAYQLRKALGVSPTLASRLWKGEFTQIGVTTLDRLCRVLKCQPDKFLRYEADVESDRA